MSKDELDRMAKGQKCAEESSLLFTQDLIFIYCKLDFFRVDLLHALYQKVVINAKKNLCLAKLQLLKSTLI